MEKQKGGKEEIKSEDELKDKPSAERKSKDNQQADEDDKKCPFYECHVYSLR